MSLTLEPCTLADIPHLSSIWFAAFTDPSLRQLWPDTPLVRAWWDKSNTTDFVHRSDRQVFLKVVDNSTAPTTTLEGTADATTQGPRIAGYAKWDLCSPLERGRRYPEWCEDMPAARCDAFFAREEMERERVMKGEKHYYLDTLAVHPDYQRRGAGTMLVMWGVGRAEMDGVGVYLDASREGKGLYEKCGFVDESLEEERGEGGVASMAIHRR